MFEFFHSISIGFIHVLPAGLDHIVFIICIFLASKSMKEMIILCSAFTIAHSISLAMALTNWISIPSSIIEPMIAFTILIAAIENIFLLKNNQWKPFIVFFFGLIHGLGFASAFRELNVPTNVFIQTLVGFNLGVECAQLLIVMVLFYTLTKHLSKKQYYENKIVKPIATSIACLAIFWSITRL